MIAIGLFLWKVDPILGLMVLVTDFDQCQTKWHPPCVHYPVITLFIITVIIVHLSTLTCPVIDLRSDITVTGHLSNLTKAETEDLRHLNIQLLHRRLVRIIEVDLDVVHDRFLRAVLIHAIDMIIIVQGKDTLGDVIPVVAVLPLAIVTVVALAVVDILDHGIT